ncbi:MAG: sterol desaturase family protein [Rhodospirillaceae bacterium]|nr:sterol desaturase family protein [Rhodospirillaceae bacterium]
MDFLAMMLALAAEVGPVNGPIVAAVSVLSVLLLAVSGPLILAEGLWLWRRGALTRRRIVEMLASYATVLPTVAVQGLAFAWWWAAYSAVARIAPFEITTTWASAIVCIVVVDLLYYWDHRLGHAVRGLWAVYHSVHHSSPSFDQSTAFRISFVDQFIVPVFYLPAVVAGFDPWLIVAAQSLVLAYQSWIHTEMIGRLGWLDLIVNTPSNHRVHHGAQPCYRDMNYGGILMIWDHLFGTYRAETERPAYGLVTPIWSNDPVTVMGCEAWRLMRALSAAGGPAQWVHLILGRP